MIMEYFISSNSIYKRKLYMIVLAYWQDFWYLYIVFPVPNIDNRIMLWSDRNDIFSIRRKWLKVYISTIIVLKNNKEANKILRGLI